MIIICWPSLPRCRWGLGWRVSSVDPTLGRVGLSDAMGTGGVAGSFNKAFYREVEMHIYAEILTLEL